MTTEIPEKQLLLKNSFFSLARQANLNDIREYIYLILKEFPDIIKREIRTAINISHPNKTAGKNNLIFRVL